MQQSRKVRRGIGNVAGGEESKDRGARAGILGVTTGRFNLLGLLFGPPAPQVESKLAVPVQLANDRLNCFAQHRLYYRSLNLLAY